MSVDAVSELPSQETFPSLIVRSMPCPEAPSTPRAWRLGGLQKLEIFPKQRHTQRHTHGTPCELIHCVS